MAQESIIFERGQVWYWQDPVFGRKKKGGNEEPRIGEAMYRFSRYVVVVQDPETFNPNRLLVVPLSTGVHYEHDVLVDLKQIYLNQQSYAKCTALFPVYPRLLSSYICKLSDETMRQIDAELIKLLCPFIRNTFSNNDIKEWFGIDMEYKHAYKKLNNPCNVMNKWIKKFICEEIEITGNCTDSVSVQKLKTSFEVFCLNNGIDQEVYQDEFRFLDAFTKMLANHGIISVSNLENVTLEIVNLTEFNGIKIKHDRMKVVIQVKKPEIPSKEQVADQPEKVSDSYNMEKGSDSSRNDWTDTKNQMNFVSYYEAYGQEACAAKYKVSEASCRTYYRKFKKNLSNKMDQHVLNPHDVGQSISRISNCIKDYLMQCDMHRVCKGNGFREIEFYHKLQKATYFSIIEFMNIRLEKNSLILPIIDTDTQYYDTWKFFDLMQHDSRLNVDKNISDLMDLGRQLYGNKFGLNPEWLDYVHMKFTKLGLRDNHVDTIVASIASQFTTR